VNALEVIGRKRDGREHSAEEIQFLLAGYLRGDIPDYQMAAWLMAVCLRGMTRAETLALTQAMVASGEVLDLSGIEGIKVDKHSTGGVGDKVTLIAGPLAAACGVRVPKLSGRALAHTGGTLDKLESVPGLTVDLDPDRFIRQVREIGIAVAAQSPHMVPADKALYALRDVTATVPSVPLIASSVMSKKIAAGADAIVLDVKFGRGAFMPDPNRAQALARAMIQLGADRGCPVVALLTAMDRPLGFACGNAMEVRESIDALRGAGPDDLMEVTYALGAEMLMLGGVASSPADAWRMMRDAIGSGQALEKFAEIIEAQGGNPRIVDDQNLLASAPLKSEYAADRDGFITEVAPRAVGYGIITLRGGRRTMEDTIDPSVGFIITAKPGDSVQRGQTLATIHALDAKGVREGTWALNEAITIGDDPPIALDLVSVRMTGAGIEKWERPGV